MMFMLYLYSLILHSQCQRVMLAQQPMKGGKNEAEYGLTSLRKMLKPSAIIASK